jgi:hypothetical protein
MLTARVELRIESLVWIKVPMITLLSFFLPRTGRQSAGVLRRIGWQTAAGVYEIAPG